MTSGSCTTPLRSRIRNPAAYPFVRACSLLASQSTASATSQHRNSVSICANCCVFLLASTDVAVVWSEIGYLSLQQQWLQALIRFWNQVVYQPAGDLYRDLMSDSLQEAVTHTWPVS